jgi:hypothetical protein
MHTNVQAADDVHFGDPFGFHDTLLSVGGRSPPLVCLVQASQVVIAVLGASHGRGLVALLGLGHLVDAGQGSLTLRSRAAGVAQGRTSLGQGLLTAPLAQRRLGGRGLLRGVHVGTSLLACPYQVLVAAHVARSQLVPSGVVEGDSLLAQPPDEGSSPSLPQLAVEGLVADHAVGADVGVGPLGGGAVLSDLVPGHHPPEGGQHLDEGEDPHRERGFVLLGVSRGVGVLFHCNSFPVLTKVSDEWRRREHRNPLTVLPAVWSGPSGLVYPADV